MRHRVAKRHFNRDSKHRKAMIMNLVRNLIVYGEIETTKEKAKEVKRWADKLVYKAKKGDVATRRNLHTFFGKRDVVNTLVDRIAPLFPNRDSGFTTHKSLGKRRGDNTEMVSIGFINKPETLGTLKAPKEATPKAAKTKAAPKAAKTATKEAKDSKEKSTKKVVAKKTK